MINLYEYTIWGVSVIMGIAVGYLFAWYQIWYKKKRRRNDK
jgi:hypothetical protein